MSKLAAKSGRRSRSEWLSLMSAYEAGDLSQRVFCQRHALAYSTFSYWRKQLRSPVVSSVQESAPLLELSSFSLDNSIEWRVELELGSGMCLRLR